MIKRYGWAMKSGWGGDYMEREESEGGTYVLFTDHESDKAQAIAAKDAEIAELHHYVSQLVAASAEIAEQVRERCASICENVQQTGPVAIVCKGFAEKIRTADLSDITGKD